MNSSHALKYYPAEIISGFVSNRVKEGLQFSFRLPGEILPVSESKINSLVNEVCSLANTIGGTIVFGIAVNRGKADKFVFPENQKYNPGLIQNILETRIRKKINGLKIDLVPIGQEKDILVIQVPESVDAPHMADDNKYYTRKKNKNIPMEEHEVRQCYHKKLKTVLELIGISNSNGIPTLSNGKFVSLIFLPRFLIRNIGQTIVKDYKFELSIPSSLCDENYFALNAYFSRYEGKHNIYSIPGKVPLFQDETHTVSEAKLLVTGKNYNEYASEKIHLSLFFPDGVRYAEFNIPDTFQYNNRYVLKEDFID